MIKDNNIFISVIIPTKDRQGLLENAIDSLLNQSLDKEYYEIVIMDQSSGNETKEYINRLNYQKDCKIRYIYNKKIVIISNIGIVTFGINSFYTIKTNVITN